MDETINRAFSALKEAFDGYSFVDQAYMFNKVTELCLDEMGECLELEYGLTNKKSE